MKKMNLLGDFYLTSMVVSSVIAVEMEEGTEEGRESEMSEGTNPGEALQDTDEDVESISSKEKEFFNDPGSNKEEYLKSDIITALEESNLALKEIETNTASKTTFSEILKRGELTFSEILKRDNLEPEGDKLPVEDLFKGFKHAVKLGSSKLIEEFMNAPKISENLKEYGGSATKPLLLPILKEVISKKDNSALLNLLLEKCQFSTGTINQALQYIVSCKDSGFNLEYFRMIFIAYKKRVILTYN